METREKEKANAMMGREIPRGRRRLGGVGDVSIEELVFVETRSDMYRYTARLPQPHAVGKWGGQ